MLSIEFILTLVIVSFVCGVSQGGEKVCVTINVTVHCYCSLFSLFFRCVWWLATTVKVLYRHLL